MRYCIEASEPIASASIVIFGSNKIIERHFSTRQYFKLNALDRMLIHNLNNHLMVVKSW